jgi:hypothetical protein
MLLGIKQRAEALRLGRTDDASAARAVA